MKDYDKMYAVSLVSRDGELVDIERYRQYVVSLEKPVEESKLGSWQLMSVLRMAVAAGNLADIYKKKVVYGQDGMRDRLLAANAELQHACRGLESNIIHEPEELQALPHPINTRLLHHALGLFGEAAELLNAVLQQAVTGELDTVNVLEELGDSDYYLIGAHDSIGVPVSLSLGRNTAKLDVRFGGAWELDKTAKRDLASEREALEGRS